MPVLTLGDTGLTDIHAELTVIGSFQQLSERPAIVAVHLQLELKIRSRQVTQVQTVQLLCKAAVRDRRDNQCAVLRLELLQQIYDLAERDLVGQRHITIPTVWILHRIQPIILAALLFALEQIKHRFDEIVYVEQLNLRTAVIDRKRKIIRYRITKSRYCTVIIRAAVSHQIREAIHRDLHAVFLAVSEKQLLTRELRLAVIRACKATDQRRLN